MEPKLDELLSQGETGRLLGMTSAGVAYWVKRSGLAPIGRTKNGPIFRKSDVEDFRAKLEAARAAKGGRRAGPMGSMQLTLDEKRRAAG